MPTAEEVEQTLASSCPWCHGSQVGIVNGGIASWANYWCTGCGGSGKQQTIRDPLWYPVRRLDAPAPWTDITELCAVNNEHARRD